MEFKVKNIEELALVADQILSATTGNIYTFVGDLGAGKTTLIKALCSHLGVISMISSPTFSVINEYDDGNKTIYHMDWYRLETLDQLMNIGIEEYLISGNVCFIEWPQVGEPLFDEDIVNIHIFIDDQGDRIIKVN